MKLSSRLFGRVEPLWEEASNQAFVREMAEGILDENRFKAYMIQDYHYLKEYIGILQLLHGQAAEPPLKAFLRKSTQTTRREMEMIHLPQMKALGISEAEIEGSGLSREIAAYLEYMKAQAEEGLIPGLTALLQCSWAYAYIAKRVTERCPQQIANSPYKGWFDAYTSPDYISSNENWIAVLDSETEGITEEYAETLCGIFENCAAFENRFWESVYRKRI